MDMISDQNKSRDFLTAPLKTDEVFDVNRDGERSTVKEGSLCISLIIVLVSRGTEATRAAEQGAASERERLGNGGNKSGRARSRKRERERETGGVKFPGALYRGVT